MSESPSPLLAALYRGDLETVSDLSSSPSLDATEAAALGDVPRLEALLAANRDVVHQRSPDGFTLVALAAFFGRQAAVDLLLSHGADPDVPADNPMKVTALHAAIAGGHTEIALRVLGAGANPNAPQQAGWTPLHQAAHNGDAVMVRALLDAGADRTVTNEAGVTAAALAADSGDPEVRALLA